MSIAGRLLLTAAVLVVSAPPSFASFHVMEIEQVIGGVNGDVTAQAIQLRMRSGGQNFVGGRTLVVTDATGSNPITLVTMAAGVTNGTIGDRILIYTPAMGPYLPGVPADFTMAPIPPSYLAAGSLVWAGGYWRVSW